LGLGSDCLGEVDLSTVTVFRCSRVGAADTSGIAQ